MKRALTLVVALLLIIPHFTLADTVDMSGAKAALIAPLQSNIAIEQKNEGERYKVAGLCKLPALLALSLAFDEGVILPDTMMQVSHKAASIGGPTAFLENAEQVKAAELMKAAVMISAGDAIFTLGENAFGSEQVFAQNIEVVMRELGLDISITDCLCKDESFTAMELLAIGQAAAQSPTFLQYCGAYMDELVHSDGRRTELVNANRMIRNYSGCFGLMTGSSRDDGYCGVFVAKRNDMSYVCVIIGSQDSEKRFSLATALFDYVFANFQLLTLGEAYVPLMEDVTVLYGDSDTINLVPHETIVMLQKKGDNELVFEWQGDEELAAPLRADTAVGTVIYKYEGGEPLFELELYPQNDVRSKSFFDLLRRLAYNFLGG